VKCQDLSIQSKGEYTLLNDILSLLISSNFLASVLRLSTPLLIATMGGIFSEKSGILFLGMEGFMLTGAFFAFVGGFYFNPWVGILFAIGVSLILGLIYAFSTITLAVNQVVISVAFNLMALGLTSALFRKLLGTNTQALESNVFSAINIPVLSSIPYLGVMFQRTGFTYLGFILVPVVYIIFFKTKLGLKIRASGEHPTAAQNMGVNVLKIRYISVLWAAVFAAIGGASLTIGDIGLFVDNMIAGKGFIGFAAIILGRFHPVGTMISVLFFGIVDSFQLNLQAMGSIIPYQFPLMMPYVLTLIAFLIAGSGLAPKAWAIPYKTE
jgi:general nucleoside transport system permease protein